MRKDYNRTSPDLMHNLSSHYKSPYLSPKHNNQQMQTLKSFSQSREQEFENRYPHSYKYNSNPPQMIHQNQYQYQHQHQNPNQYQSQQRQQADPIEISQLKLTISQLRASLHTYSENSQRLQEQLFQQRKKNMEFAEMRRRLEEEIKRMEFQFERIGNYDSLQSRQATIKLQTALRQNTKLSHQVSDFIEQIKTLKQQHRKLMSECDNLLKEKHILMAQNESLSAKLEDLQYEVRDIKRQVSQQSLNIVQSQRNIPSRINNIPTERTHNQTTIASPVTGSKQSIELEELPQEVDYEEENEKLQKDYQKLLIENESIRKLYSQFYKNDEKSASQSNKPSSISENPFSNRAITKQLQSSRLHEPVAANIMLVTRQKHQVEQQVAQVRQLAITTLFKSYNKILQKSSSEHKNSLKLFTQEIVKKIEIYAKMAENYLEIRSTINQETGIKLPEPIESFKPKNQNQVMVLQIYQSIKSKAKGQKQVGLSLAIFRILTLLSKISNISDILLENIKHSALKYIYKMKNQ